MWNSKPKFFFCYFLQFTSSKQICMKELKLNSQLYKIFPIIRILFTQRGTFITTPGLFFFVWCFTHSRSSPREFIARILLGCSECDPLPVPIYIHLAHQKKRGWKIVGGMSAKSENDRLSIQCVSIYQGGSTNYSAHCEFLNGNCLTSCQFFTHPINSNDKKIGVGSLKKYQLLQSLHIDFTSGGTLTACST